MNAETYIQAGDRILVAPCTTRLPVFEGRVAAIGDGAYGRRVLLVEKDGTPAEVVPVAESEAILSVLRGDSWVSMPLPMLREEAEVKSLRNEKNQRRRVEKQAPLLAGQIAIHPIDPEKMIENMRREGERTLDFDHGMAMEANRLRAALQSLVSEAAYQDLCQRRLSFPRTGEYGANYWRKQLAYYQEHGVIERLELPRTAAEVLHLPWLAREAVLTWTAAPGGPQKVTVLWIGSTKVLCKLCGEPVKDYDPRAFPENGNVWLAPNQFAEYAAAVPQPVAA